MPSRARGFPKCPTIATTLLLMTLTVLGVNAPSPASAGNAAHDLQPGLWHAWLDCREVELEFGLQIQTTTGHEQATILNGEEKQEITRVHWEGSEVIFEIAEYDAGLRATPSRNGTRLDGGWWRRLGADYWARLPFHAELQLDPKPGSSAAATVEAGVITPADREFEGRWAVKFAARPDSSVGLFRATSAGMRGTFMNSTGDYRDLAGYVRDGRLFLSRFDGAHAFHFEATLNAASEIAGEFWEADYLHTTWSGRRDSRAQPPDPFRQLESGAPLDLAKIHCFDLSGQQRTLSEFRGKGLIVEIFGTWCPNCHDSSRYLSELYGRYHDRGLSVVGLAFEMSADFERNVRQVRFYKTKSRVAYPVVLAYRNQSLAPTKLFPTITGFYAYPTLLFVDRHGRVQATYVGFAGPATGEEHQKMRRNMEEIVDRMLAE